MPRVYTEKLEIVGEKIEMLEEAIVFTQTFIFLYPDEPTLQLALDSLRYAHMRVLEDKLRFLYISLFMSSKA